MGKFSRLGNDLYGGRKSYDFVHKKTIWYAISLVLVVGAIAIVMLRGLNFGIEFTGGTQYKVSLPTSQVNQTNADTIREAVAGAGVAEAEAPIVTTAGEAILVQIEEISQEESDTITAAIEGSVDGVGDISQDEISASWGQEVAQRAALGVTIFIVLVMLFIGVYFREWKMSVAAFVALFHDIAITIGIYALSGFQVTPSAVTGLLAILGFSLYDTVVVFDKVKENTHEMRETRQTYAQAANLAVNQTLVRSINTGIVALIPIGAILYVSATQLGSSSLQDLALSQFVGMAVGVYSSIFLAPRVLVHLKSNETEVVLAEKRARARARAAADKYASVPTTHAEDTPVVDRGPEDDFDEDDGVPAGTAPARTAPPRAPEASGRGRVAPEARGPIRPERQRRRTQPAQPQAAVEAGQDVTDAHEAMARLVRDVPDFPEPGVMFKDITPLLADHAGFTAVVEALADAGRDDGATAVDKVVGMEARGFILGAPVALSLGAGFVPVRKAGKLPRETHAVSYELEYGSATLEVHRDAISPGERVLLVDDVLATGGTVAATRELVEACGGVVVGVAMLMELTFLPGRAAVGELPLTVLLSV